MKPKSKMERASLVSDCIHCYDSCRIVHCYKLFLPFVAADKPAEPEDVATPPVDVTVSYLISTEDALAKGIAEEDVERFK